MHPRTANPEPPVAFQKSSHTDSATGSMLLFLTPLAFLYLTGIGLARLALLRRA